MAEWYLNGGGLESNGHSSFSTVGEDGSITLATQEQAHSGTWSAKLSIPTSGAARLVRQAEPVQNPELYYTVWYYFPRSYTIPSSPGFWMLQQWKSRVPAEGKHDPFFMLQAYNPAPGSMKFKLCWFPLPIEGPLPGQRGYREWCNPDVDRRR